MTAQGTAHGIAQGTAAVDDAGTAASEEQPKPTHGLDVALRLTVLGPDGRVDLAVPYGTEVRDLAASYADRAGLSAAPALALATGRVLDPDADVDDLQQGDVLVPLGASTTGSDGSAEPEAAAETGRSAALAGPLGRHLLVLACAVALAAAVAGASGAALAEPPAWTRPLAAGVLVLGALVVALRAAARGTAGEDSWVAGPALAAAGGFVLAYRPGTGGVLLALAVGGLAACVTAAVARTGAEPVGEQVLRAWLVVGAVVSGGAVAWLLLGAGVLALACVALVVAVLVTRMLPGFAVDVDDDVLLDLDRLAVTAWSARETPRGGRRRHQVRLATVQEVAARSRRTVLAGVLVTTATAVVAGPVVLLAGTDRTPWAAGGAAAMVALAAASLALVGRSFRSRVPRLLLGATATWLALVAGAVVASRLDAAWLWYSFAAVAVVAPVVLVAAVQLGRGWRSVWWARTGEVVETLTGVLVVALLPLASGLFDLVRTSFS